MIYVRRTIRDSIFCTEETLLTTASQVETEAGIQRRVRYFLSDRIVIPMAWRVIRPVVILPRVLLPNSSALRMVLKHELAHIKRNDIVWLNFASIVTILHWFNPLAWMVRRKMLKESEYACDDFVLSAGTAAQEYARLLLESTRDFGLPGSMVMTRTAYTTQLEGRIMSILTHRKREPFTSNRLAAVTITLAAMIVLPLSTVTFQACQSGDTNKTETAAVAPSTSEALPSPDEFVAVDSTPVMTYQAPTVYPPDAKSEGAQGAVWVKALIDKTGAVAEIQVAKSSGDARLDNAALEAGKANKFTPALKDGLPVASWISYKVVFELSDKK